MDWIQLSQGFTTTSPEVDGTHFVDLVRIKGWVDLGAWDYWMIFKTNAKTLKCYSEFSKMFFE